MSRTRLLNRTFGKLSVISYAGPVPRHHLWKCRCDCGTVKVVRENNLLTGSTISCGCHRRVATARALTKHGMYGTPEYITWRNMLRRCTKNNDPSFYAYGGRGIKVCARWADFANFLADMGPKPTPDHSIERRDVNGDYCPENCYWLPKSRQHENTRQNRPLTINGVTQNVSAWAKQYGHKYTTVAARLRKGWPPLLVLTTPVVRKRRRMTF